MDKGKTFVATFQMKLYLNRSCGIFVVEGGAMKEVFVGGSEFRVVVSGEKVWKFVVEEKAGVEDWVNSYQWEEVAFFQQKEQAFEWVEQVAQKG